MIRLTTRGSPPGSVAGMPATCQVARCFPSARRSVMLFALVSFVPGVALGGLVFLDSE